MDQETLDCLEDALIFGEATLIVLPLLPQRERAYTLRVVPGLIFLIVGPWAGRLAAGFINL